MKMLVSRLVYRSKCADWLSKEDLKEILGSSHQNNKARNISGVLCLDEDYFIQFVEGPHEALNELLMKLVHDKRHQNIEVIEFIRKQKREFGQWEMLLLGNDKETSFLMRSCIGDPNIRPWQLDAELITDFICTAAQKYLGSQLNK